MLPLMLSIIFHPVTMFGAGLISALIVVFVVLGSWAGPNETQAFVANYRQEMAKAGKDGPVAGSSEERAALARFTEFLQQIGDQSFLRENTKRVYSEGAYLNDTLVTHQGSAEIEAYFLKTSETMKGYQVQIDDVFRSGDDHYVRWTMIFEAPALAKGEPIHSVGISQVRFANDGRVAFHQDFWDSGANIFGQAPVAGSIINFIRKRLG